MNTYTTLAELREANACKDSYRHLCKALGGARKYGRDTPLDILAILEHNGFDDAAWAVRHCPSLKPLYDAYLAQINALYDAYEAQRQALDDAYRALRKAALVAIVTVASGGTVGLKP